MSPKFWEKVLSVCTGVCHQIFSRGERERDYMPKVNFIGLCLTVSIDHLVNSSLPHVFRVIEPVVSSMVIVSFFIVHIKMSSEWLIDKSITRWGCCLVAFISAASVGSASSCGSSPSRVLDVGTLGKSQVPFNHFAPGIRISS